MAEEVVVDFKINVDESLRVLNEINVQMAELKKEKEALDKAMKDGTATQEMIEQYTELEVTMKTLSKARKAEEKEIYQEAQQYRYAADTIQGMSDRLRQAKDNYRKMSEEDRKSADGMKLAAQIKQTTAEIDAMNNVIKPTIIDKFSAKLAVLPKTFQTLQLSIKTFKAQAITSIRAIGAAFAANPFGLILTAIALAVTGLIVIFKKLKGEFEKDKTATNEFKKVLAGIQPIIDALKAGFDAVVGAAVKFYTTIAKGVNWVLSLIPALKKSQDAMVEHQKIQEQVAKSEANLATIRRENALKLKRLNQIISDSENYSVEERKQALYEKIELMEAEHKALLKSIDDKITEAKVLKATAKSYEDWKKASQSLTALYEAQASADWDYVDSLGDVQKEINNIGKKAAEDAQKHRKEAAENYQKTEEELWQMTFDLMEEGRKKAEAIENYNYEESKKRAEREIKDEKQRKEYLELLEKQHQNNLANIRKQADAKELSDKKAHDLLIQKQADLAKQAQLIRDIIAAEGNKKAIAELNKKAADERLKQAQEEYDNIAYLDTKRQIELYGSIEAYELAVAEADLKVAESQQAVADAAKNVQDQISAGQQAIVNKVVGTLDAFQTVTNGFGDLFNVLAEDNEKYQKYASVLAYVDIMINMAKAIAQAIAAAKAPFPYNLIEIATGIAAVTSGIASAISIYKKNNKVESRPKFATGGLVGNQTTTRTDDSVNAKLSVGEYVIQSKVVKALGVDFLDRLNGGSGDNTNRFATGGLVPSIPTVSAIDSQVNYDQMRNLMLDALENIHPVVSVKEVTNMQQKVQVKENIARY